MEGTQLKRSFALRELTMTMVVAVAVVVVVIMMMMMLDPSLLEVAILRVK